MLNVVIFTLISKRNINLNIGRKSYNTTSRGGIISEYLGHHSDMFGIFSIQGGKFKFFSILRWEAQGGSSRGKFKGRVQKESLKEHGIYR